MAASNLTTERRLSLEEKRLVRLTRTGSDDVSLEECMCVCGCSRVITFLLCFVYR